MVDGGNPRHFASSASRSAGFSRSCTQKRSRAKHLICGNLNNGGTDPESDPEYDGNVPEIRDTLLAFLWVWYFYLP
jgi:hypothetical protein